MLVERKQRVEVWSRTDAGWALLTVQPPTDAISLDAIDAKLSLAALYRDSGR